MVIKSIWTFVGVILLISIILFFVIQGLSSFTHKELRDCLVWDGWITPEILAISCTDVYGRAHCIIEKDGSQIRVVPVNPFSNHNSLLLRSETNSYTYSCTKWRKE